MKKISQLITEIDLLIKQSLITDAAVQFETLMKCKSVPQEARVKISNLARRLHLPKLAIKVLSSRVRPTGRHEKPATSEEKLEYAASLAKLGATREAIELFKTLNAEKDPLVLLFQSFAHFSRWEYSNALPLLKRYIEFPNLSEYDRAVGEVNLLGTLVHLNVDQADKVLNHFLMLAKEKKYSRLLLNGYIMGADLARQHSDWSRCESYLKLAKSELKGEMTLESLFIKKHEALLELYRCKGSLIATSKLREVEKEALQRGHWETKRHCDFHKALFFKSEEYFLHLYFGTPYEAYRGELMELYGNSVQIPSRYLWIVPFLKLPEKKGIKPLEFDWLVSNDGSVPYLLLKGLCSDFYRPMRIAELFSVVYPGEYYNALTSFNRIQQVTFRLRKLLSSKKIPLELVSQDGTLSLKALAPIQIVIPQRILEKEAKSPIRLKCEGVLEAGVFYTIRELMEIFVISKSGALRMVREGQENKVIEVRGEGKARRYSLRGTTEVVAGELLKKAG